MIGVTGSGPRFRKPEKLSEGKIVCLDPRTVANSHAAGYWFLQAVLKRTAWRNHHPAAWEFANARGSKHTIFPSKSFSGFRIRGPEPVTPEHMMRRSKPAFQWQGTNERIHRQWQQGTKRTQDRHGEHQFTYGSSVNSLVTGGTVFFSEQPEHSVGIRYCAWA